MQDSKGRDSAETEDKLADRKSEATSDQTLSEIEETEEDAGAPEKSSGAGPSPDGTLDETDELKDAGPM